MNARVVVCLVVAVLSGIGCENPIRSQRQSCIDILEDAIEWGAPSCRTGLFLFGFQDCGTQDENGETRAATAEERSACEADKEQTILTYCLVEYAQREACSTKSDAPFSKIAPND